MVSAAFPATTQQAETRQAAAVVAAETQQGVEASAAATESQQAVKAAVAAAMREGGDAKHGGVATYHTPGCSGGVGAAAIENERASPLDGSTTG